MVLQYSDSAFTNIKSTTNTRSAQECVACERGLLFARKFLLVKWGSAKTRCEEDFGKVGLSMKNHLYHANTVARRGLQ